MVQRHDVERLRQINPVAWEIFTNDFSGVNFVLWVRDDGTLVIQDEDTDESWVWDGKDWIIDA